MSLPGRADPAVRIGAAAWVGTAVRIGGAEQAGAAERVGAARAGSGVRGAGVRGAGVLGAGVLGAGVLGAGVLGVGVLVLALLAGSVPAWAARPILLESHEEEPSPEVRRLLRVVHRAVARFVDSDAALRPRIDAFYGRAEPALTDAEVGSLFASLKKASMATYRGEWPEAIAVLQRVRALLRRDPRSVARRRPLFKALQQARILLAMCYSRTGKTDQAWQMMEAALRSDPDLTLPGVFYGPVLQRLYYRVKTQLDLRRGTLRVETYPSGALIFLSGRNVGVSPVQLTGLYQGTYELLVVHGPQVSRTRRVTVNERPASVRVDLAAEAPIRTTPFVGLLLPRGKRRLLRETRLARDMGRRLGCSRVLLVGLQHLGDRLVLVGRSVSVAPPHTGSTAYVELEPLPPSRVTLIRLARYLLHGGTAGQGVHVVSPAELGPARPKPALRGEVQARGRGRGLAVAAWTLFGLGLAGAAGGGVAWWLDGRTSRPATQAEPREVYQTRTLGISLLGAGLGLAAVGAVLLIVDAALPRARAPSGSRAAGSLRSAAPPQAPRAGTWTITSWAPSGSVGLGAAVRF